MEQRWLVKWDFLAYNPPDWHGFYDSIFGRNNEGVTIKAKDLEEAKSKMLRCFNINPEYCKYKKIEE